MISGALRDVLKSPLRWFQSGDQNTELPAVVFLIFNRPEATRRSFAAIRAARPRRLLIIADGPRSHRPGERELCEAARRLVEDVDWPCKVSREYADSNMGCGYRVASGLYRAFDAVDEAIVIEDDCVVDPSFFPFCAELLHRYRDDDRVMMISGNNFQNGIRRTEDSYYFSALAHCWGWATWRRAWAGYDFEMQAWGHHRQTGWLKSKIPHAPLAAVLQAQFDSMWRGKRDTWDYQWLYHVLSRDGLSVAPNANLVENIGFGIDATHTVVPDRRYVLKPSPMLFPLKHPDVIKACKEADEFEMSYLYR